MFVAFTGYGRIATLGEEVREPRRTIPKAMIAALVGTIVIYALVAGVAVTAAGAPALAAATKGAAAPLEVVARGFEVPGVAWLVAAGAVTAMLGVLLNLLLGLSRVLLAMARRRDVPGRLAVVDQARSSPTAAVVVVGLIVGGLVAIGDVKTTWSFSAFTVLVYYALTNLAALKLTAEERLFPRWVSAAGLVFCLGLSVWVEPQVWAVGLGLIVLGLLWQAVAVGMRPKPTG
jgi:APA family basic amino acid/polyamine antiporter